MKPRNKIIDYIFWISFILFTNPGGIQNVFNIYELRGGLNFNDLLIPVFIFCYIVTIKTKVVKDLYYNRIVLSLTFFILYYFVAFCYFIPIYNNTFTSLGFTLIKIRHTIYSFILLFITYRFFQRSYFVFFKLYLYSSSIILILFIITFLSNIPILPVISINRGFVNIDRNLLVSYGLMPFLIPLGISFLLFRNKASYNWLVYISFGLMAASWLLSLTRRHLLGAAIYFLIGYFLLIYFQRISVMNKMKSLFRTFFLILILFFALYKIFPDYLVSGKESVKETLYVIEYGETSKGRQDERLGLSKPFIIEIFKENFLFGTGFDNRWRTDIGDYQGYEASDYPFISSLAMFGIIGILLFLPIYVLIIIAIIKDIRFIHRSKIFFNNALVLLHIAFIIWFIYEIMRYIDWFHPISNPVDNYWYYIVGFYLASRKLIYVNLKAKSIRQHE